MSCQWDEKSALGKESADLILILRVISEKMLKSGNALYHKLVFGMLLCILQVFKNIKLLKMSIGNKAFAAKFKGAVKASSPGKVLMVYHKYGKIAQTPELFRRRCHIRRT